MPRYVQLEPTPALQPAMTGSPAAPEALATWRVYAGWALACTGMLFLEWLALDPAERADAGTVLAVWAHMVCASIGGWAALSWMHAHCPRAWRPAGAPALLAMGLAHLAGSVLAVEGLRLVLQLGVLDVAGGVAGGTALANDWLQRLWIIVVFNTLPALLLAAWRLRTHRLSRWQERLAAASAEQQGVRQELIESELLALQAQVEPHFLFNTLAHIRWHYRHDPLHAGHMLERLVHFARDLLPAAQGAAVAMRVELGLVRHYLELLSLRLGPRLRWEIQVPDEVLDAQVPSMGLLTLVENAIQHGIGRLGRGGTVQVLARAVDGRLHIEVLDDGVGLSDGAGANVGLANLRAKLLLMAGDAARFELRSRAGGGARAVITLPLQHEGRAGTAVPTPPPASQGLPWGLLAACIGALWAWQLLATGLSSDPRPADWPRAVMEVPLLTLCMLPLAVVAWRLVPAGPWSMALLGVAMLAGAALGMGLSQQLLAWAAAQLPCDGSAGCARDSRDAMVVSIQAWLFAGLMALAARARIANARIQQRALTLAAQSAELRRHAAAVRLRAARARAEPADVVRMLQQVQERYGVSPMDGEATLDALTSYLRCVAETAHSPRVSLQRELDAARAFAALVRASRAGDPGDVLQVECDDRINLATQVEPLRLLQPLRLLWAAAPSAALRLRLEACPGRGLVATLACPQLPPEVDAEALAGALAPLDASAVRHPDGSMHWRLDVELS